MKKFYAIITVCLIVFALFSCKKDKDDAIDPNAKKIIQFKIENLNYSAEVDQQTKTIDIVLPSKANLSKITPYIKISAGASVEPASRQEVDLSEPIVYRVTAQNGSHQDYTVTTQKVSDTALLIIDMQNGAFSNPEYPIYNRSVLCESINMVSEKARESSIPVVFVMAKTGNLVVGSPEWQVIPDINKQEGDLIADKLSSDAFQVGDLQGFLSDIGIGCIIITGVATDMCINNTFIGAREKAYDIIVISDGHSTSDPGAQEKIDNHNNIWANAGAWVVSSEEIGF